MNIDDGVSRKYSNSTKGGSIPHTDDSALPRYARTESILLRGIKNGSQSTVQYNSLRCALQSKLVVNTPRLLEPTYKKRAPLNCRHEADLWISPEPIIVDVDRRLELSFSSYDTEAIYPRHDHALKQLKFVLKELATSVALDADTFMIFSIRYSAQSRPKNNKGYQCRHRVGVT